MSIKVCKTYATEKVETVCRGAKEFLTCEKETIKQDVFVCGVDKTFDLAKQDLAKRLQKFDFSRYTRCILKPEMSATDQGVTFLDFLEAITLQCSNAAETQVY